MMAGGGELDDGGYEAPERLMDKTQVQELCKIMAFAPSTINNYEEMPQPPRFGAGLVNPFADSDKRSFLDTTAISSPKTPEVEVKQPQLSSHGLKQFPAKKIRRMDLIHMSNEILISRYTFMPRFNDLYHNVGTQESFQRNSEEDLKTKFPNTAYSFRMSSEVIKQRAAWSWWRTGLCYEESAEQALRGGARQKALGLSSLGSSAASELQSIVHRLKDKAARAKAHALSLCPDFLHKESPSYPSWGENYSSGDVEYYKEMADNHSRVQRVNVSEKYKGSAMLYVCEAISVYLEWKKENPEKSKKYAFVRLRGTLSSSLFAGTGAIAKLWSEASHWSQDPNTSARDRKRFREWWIRAAMARGHAEWLVSEMKEIDQGKSPRGYNTSDSWRLLDPAPVLFFTHDCVARAGVELIQAVARFRGDGGSGDEFYTHYVKIQMGIAESAWVSAGERNYNCGPGAPDRIFYEKADTGWARNLLGHFPLDSSTMSIETGYYERYRRKGLADHMAPTQAPSKAYQYEKALAVCVDDIILEWEHNRLFFASLSANENAGVNILADLEADVMKLVSVRVLLTRVQAETYHFYEELEKTLTHHFDRITELFTDSHFENSEKSPRLCYLVKVKQLLLPMLQPWYTFDIFSRATDGKAMFRLADMQGHVVLTGETAGEWRHATELKLLLEFDRLQSIYRHVDRARGALINGGKGMMPEDWYFAEIFREFLETGDETKLPLLKSGLSNEREQTVFDFRKKSLFPCNGDCGCAFDIAERKQVQNHNFRKSLAPKACEDRENIKQAFLRHEGGLAAEGNAASDLLLQLLINMRERNTENTASLLIEALNMCDSEDSEDAESIRATRDSHRPATVSVKRPGHLTSDIINAFPERQVVTTAPNLVSPTLKASQHFPLSPSISQPPALTPIPPVDRLRRQSLPARNYSLPLLPASSAPSRNGAGSTKSEARSWDRSRAQEPAWELGDMQTIEDALLSTGNARSQPMGPLGSHPPPITSGVAPNTDIESNGAADLEELKAGEYNDEPSKISNVRHRSSQFLRTAPRHAYNPPHANYIRNSKLVSNQQQQALPKQRISMLQTSKSQPQLRPWPKEEQQQQQQQQQRIRWVELDQPAQQKAPIGFRKGLRRVMSRIFN